jgi:hypothetical protein
MRLTPLNEHNREVYLRKYASHERLPTHLPLCPGGSVDERLDWLCRWAELHCVTHKFTPEQIRSATGLSISHIRQAELKAKLLTDERKTNRDSEY